MPIIRVDDPHRIVLPLRANDASHEDCDHGPRAHDAPLSSDRRPNDVLPLPDGASQLARDALRLSCGDLQLCGSS